MSDREPVVEDEVTVDAVVLGMGVAGEAVAGDLAAAGLAVVGIEAGLVGGECPYWGCIPSKMMVRAADLIAEAGRIPGMAGSSTVQPDWAPVAERIRAEATDNWDDTVAVDRFVAKGGRIHRGRGRLVAPDVVEVDGTRFRATRAVVVATGTKASIPPIPGLAGTPYWTNREAIEVARLPGSLIVLGGGAIGVELGQVFSRFGVDVTIVEAADRLLPSEEPEAGALLEEVLRRERIRTVVGTGATAVAHDDSGFTVTLAGNDPPAGEQLLVATGRRVDLDAIGVAVVGVDPAGGALAVDEHLRVSDGVWAVGDVTGRGAFTHVGMYQARIAVADILGEPHRTADYTALPRVTFTDPEVGAVGLTESQARQSGIDVGVGHTTVPSTARGWIHKAGNDGFVKLIADNGRGVLVGATAMGPNGGEVLGLLTLAVHARTPIPDLESMIYAYPTFHRGVEDALRSLR